MRGISNYQVSERVAALTLVDTGVEHFAISADLSNWGQILKFVVLLLWGCHHSTAMAAVASSSVATLVVFVQHVLRGRFSFIAGRRSF